MREFGSEFPFVPLSDGYFERFVSIFRSYAFLRSGRDTLRYLARRLYIENRCILLPAYCCDSMVRPFSENGWEVRYYSLNPDLTADLCRLELLSKKLNPRAILIMDFFGITSLRETISGIKELFPGSVIIEDITHRLLGINEIYEPGAEYYVGSIRKWLGVNDGGIIGSVRSLLSVPGYYENEFVNIRRQAQRAKADYFLSGDENLKSGYRKALHIAENVLEEDRRPCGISPESRKALSMSNVSDISRKRKANYFHLRNRLKSISSIKFLGEDRYPEVPFSLPVLIDNRDEIQKLLARKGVYAPVLWPLNEQARKTCPVASRVEEKILSLPVDQRYDYNDIEEMNDKIREVFLKK